MGKEISLIFKMVDCDYILVYRIMNIRDIEVSLFFSDFNILEIAYCVICDITEEPIIDKFKPVGPHPEFPAEIMDTPGYIGRLVHCFLFLLPVRVTL